MSTNQGLWKGLHLHLSLHLLYVASIFLHQCVIGGSHSAFSRSHDNPVTGVPAALRDLMYYCTTPSNSESASGLPNLSTGSWKISCEEPFFWSASTCRYYFLKSLTELSSRLGNSFLKCLNALTLPLSAAYFPTFAFCFAVKWIYFSSCLPLCCPLIPGRSQQQHLPPS